MSDERKELLEEANELGLEFPSNIKTEKLKLLIEAELNPEDGNDGDSEEGKKPEATVERTHREQITFAKKAATKTSIVTITNKDNRENDVMTTASVGFENEYFGLSRTVPLDIPVELEAALIDILESTTMTLHKDEIINGKRTGNKVPVRVKKFAVSYGKPIE